MISERRITFMIVAAVLLTALVVAPVAAARTITMNGTAAYVGEEQLTLGGVVFAGATELRHYTGDPGKSSTDKTIPVSGGVISELVKGIPTGSYYAVGWALPIPSDLGAVYINIQNPEATLDVMLNSSVKDSVNGKSITRGTGLDFKFYSNVGDLGVANANTINVELTLPGGGVVTTYNGIPLRFDANGQTQYIPGIILGQDAAAGTYTAIAKWARSSDFFGKGFDSKPVTFEVRSKALAITANKDSLVRGNSFAVTITGDARTDYHLCVKDGNINSPLITPGQTAVYYFIPGENDWNRTVKTNAGGTATIQFNTCKNTEDKAFTIRVNDKTNPFSYDEVKVKVEAGSVTVTTSGTGIYHIGDEITFSGTNTESNRVYLFMTGPNLDPNGVTLTTLAPVSTPDLSTFVDTSTVNADDTWSFKWNTGHLAESINAGGYTIYAASTNVSKADLSNARYATVSILLWPATGTGLTLSPGWNFVSVPRLLAAGSDTASIFNGIDTGSRSALLYNTAAGNWTQLGEDDRIAPLEGIWIYSVNYATVPLNFSTVLPLPPAERALVTGWNAIGVTGTAPATARDTLLSVKAQWSNLIGFNAGTQSFEVGIINGGSGMYTDNRDVYPGRGYWLSMSGPGTLYAIGV